MSAPLISPPAVRGHSLSVQGVSKRFGGLLAVNDVSLEVRPGEIFSVIGPNGAGKTTFFNLLTGIYTPDQGKILLSGEDITGLPPDKVAAKGVGRTFQNIRLFGAMTVLENVLVGHHIHTHTSYLASILHTPRFRREEARAKARAMELLDYMGLAHRAGELSRNLPYGEQRRLEIARALALEPKLLLLDEPAAGMNPQETDQLKEDVQRLRKELGLTIVLIEHDMSMVMSISDRITVLEYGSKIAEGLPAEIRSNPRVIEAYLGKGAAGQEGAVNSADGEKIARAVEYAQEVEGLLKELGAKDMVDGEKVKGAGELLDQVKQRLQKNEERQIGAFLTLRNRVIHDGEGPMPSLEEVEKAGQAAVEALNKALKRHKNLE